MKRLRMSVLAVGLLLGGAVGLHDVALARQATPAASPGANATPPVVSYADIRSSYELAKAALEEDGRAIAGAILAGDADAVYPRLSPAVQDLVTKDDLATLPGTLTTNRVHFELPEFGAIFDGHLAGDAIEGFFTQGETGSFALSRVDGMGDGPSGTWEGQIVAGVTTVDIEVSLAGDRGALSGSFSAPAQSIVDQPLANVSFTPSAAFGPPEDERVLPAPASMGMYSARYSWQGAWLVVMIGIDGGGAIQALSIAPEWPLPADPAAGIVSQTTFRLPFDGAWWVFWGGETVSDNYHGAAAPQRHAFDLVIWKDGGTFANDGARNEDYWAWGQPVLAPADGTVVSVINDLPDNTPGEMAPEPHPAGNHVVIETGPGEFVFIAHLQQGSVSVVAGDRVSAGQAIGLTGSSGNSSEPHIHIHAQNTADFFAPDAIGLPMVFTDYLANGEPVERGVPTRGEIVEAG